MPVILQVALGGAIGAVLRFLSIKTATQILGNAFPYGTMFVNVAGSLLMGVLAVILLGKLDGRYAPLLMTGVLGGFTTFSAFSLDAMNLIEKGRMTLAGIYMGGSVVLAMIALIAGMAIAKAIL